MLIGLPSWVMVCVLFFLLFSIFKSSKYYPLHLALGHGAAGGAKQTVTSFMESTWTRVRNLLEVSLNAPIFAVSE
jgi:hypothetical protein